LISHVAWLLPIHGNTDTEETKTDIISRAAFEPTILVFELAKTFLALDNAATAIDRSNIVSQIKKLVSISVMYNPTASLV
jgi:hypothetical protein